MSSVARLSNNQRKARFVIPQDDGSLLYTVKSKKAREPFLYNRQGQDKGPGVFIEHLDEARNEADLFVTTFLQNPKIMEDPMFLESLQHIKVCTTFQSKLSLKHT